MEYGLIILIWRDYAIIIKTKIPLDFTKGIRAGEKGSEAKREGVSKEQDVPAVGLMIIWPLSIVNCDYYNNL